MQGRTPVVAEFGAAPVFVDVLDDTFNMDPRSLEAGIRTAIVPEVPDGLVSMWAQYTLVCPAATATPSRRRSG